MGRGFAIAGLILGYIGLAVAIVIIIVTRAMFSEMERQMQGWGVAVPK